MCVWVGVGVWVCVCTSVYGEGCMCVCEREIGGLWQVESKLKKFCSICSCLLWCQLLVETGWEGGVGGSAAVRLVQMFSHLPAEPWLRTEALDKPKGKLWAELFRLIPMFCQQYTERENHTQHPFTRDKCWVMPTPGEALLNSGN